MTLTPPRPVGRPPIGDRVEIRLAADVLAEVDQWADGWHTTRAHMLRTIIELGMTTWRESPGGVPREGS